MAAAIGARQHAALHRALTERYGAGYDTAFGAASPRTPNVNPPDRDFPGRTPSVPTPPVVRFPYVSEMARPPTWVRAYQRLTCGLVPGAINAFNALGADAVVRWNAMVDQQLAWEAIDDSAMDARLAAAGYTTLGKTLPQLWTEHVVADYNTRMRPVREVQRAALARAMHSKRQLLERLVAFWHDHFSVWGTEYDIAPVFVHYDRNVIRQNATGNFRAMLEAMARSTAMMYFLDNRSNRRSGPNENFARELLELHTFGAENYLGLVSPGDVPPCPEDPSLPIGYTDLDVYETAACFTGWSVNTGTGGDGTFLYRANDHDAGVKLVLGEVIPPEQAALKDGRDVMDLLCRHPRVAKHVCMKLIRHFADDAPPQALVDSAAAIFVAQRAAPDQLKQVLAHILKSEFVREGWGGKRRRPFEAMAAALRGAGAAAFTPKHDDSSVSNNLVTRLSNAGHAPNEWPSPDGYPEIGEAWSGSSTMVMTWRGLSWMTEANENNVRLLQIVETSVAEVPQWTSRKLVEFWCNRLLGRLPTRHRLQALLNFMAQNGAVDTFVIANDNVSKTNDLKAHYNHDRLRNMVAMVMMSPEFAQR